MNYLSLTQQAAEYIVTSSKEGVTTIMMNKPKKLNGWTSPMMSAFKQALDKAHDDVNTKVIIFTGAGHYYCAGVNLSDTLKLMSPQKLHGLIV